MRIIGGALRGLRLADLGAGDQAAHLRPTSDRVREAIFNLLINGGYGDRVEGARVLDLFAGSGALALEALSRGASLAVLVDNGRVAGDVIRRNIALCQAETARHHRRDATRLGKVEENPFDLVFLDPPYGKSLGQQALRAALDGGWLTQDALIVWEEHAQQGAPSGFNKLDARRYGETWVTLLEVAPT